MWQPRIESSQLSLPAVSISKATWQHVVRETSRVALPAVIFRRDSQTSDGDHDDGHARSRRVAKKD